MFSKRATWHLAIALVLAAFLVPASPLPVAAQSIGEYFQISYDPVEFNQTEIHGNDVFYATIKGEATCIEDLPVSVSEVRITSCVLAEHQVSATLEILNPSYTITIKPFPCEKGDIIEINKSIALQFPEESESGDYNVVGELIEAKVKAFLRIDVTSYLPPSQAMGSVTYIAPANNPPKVVTITTPPQEQEMHVANVDMAPKSGGFWIFKYTYATATVTVVDARNNHVEGAMVSGHWSRATSDSNSRTTNCQGKIAFTSNRVWSTPNRTTFTFTVDDIAKSGWTYDADANTRASDSITVNPSSSDGFSGDILLLVKQVIQKISSILSQALGT